jgi:hypothetical protein
MSPTSRRLALLLAACMLACGVFVSSAGAAAREKLPTGKELGGNWRSVGTKTSTLKDAQSFSPAQQAYETSGALRRFIRRLKGGRTEEMSVIVHVTMDPVYATELFDQTARQFMTAGVVPGIGPFGEATSSQRARRSYTAIFRQGPVFASIYIERTRGAGRPAKATVNAVGLVAAEKAAAIP